MSQASRSAGLIRLSFEGSLNEEFIKRIGRRSTESGCDAGIGHLSGDGAVIIGD